MVSPVSSLGALTDLLLLEGGEFAWEELRSQLLAFGHSEGWLVSTCFEWKMKRNVSFK